MEITVKDIIGNVMSTDLGGDINSDVTEFHSNDRQAIIHFWDGRRYLIQLDRLPNGPEFDPKTGKAIIAP